MSGWIEWYCESLGRELATGLLACGEAAGSDELSRSAEVALGAHFTRQFTEAYPAFRNKSYCKYLDDLGRYLDRFIKPSEKYPFMFTPLAWRAVNAFALPGGAIFVTRGLLEFVNWERDEIAFVVAHEIGHVVCGHVRDRILCAWVRKGVQYLGNGSTIDRWIASFLRRVVTSEYSQDCEFEADWFAISLLSKANMDPMAGCSFFRRVETSGDSSTDGVLGGDLLSSHPSFGKRIERIEEFARQSV